MEGRAAWFVQSLPLGEFRDMDKTKMLNRMIVDEAPHDVWHAL